MLYRNFCRTTILASHHLRGYAKGWILTEILKPPVGTQREMEVKLYETCAVVFDRASTPYYIEWVSSQMPCWAQGGRAAKRHGMPCLYIRWRKDAKL
ncbi:hypothetical protein GQ43DRAFT_441549 [Delitschia confertaspora ATCC 74209]|uniref:Uncharacterized protein n=1 Tax=Delitschia confertaspora ATCC 74209 TaxID=1513339 RepID=A0A9P4JNP9_9PLEO|nr:hypothetical protein GQ43DRAFT_441549 [Delitschia confertaspora ATCC 74209]